MINSVTDRRTDKDTGDIARFYIRINLPQSVSNENMCQKSGSYIWQRLDEIERESERERERVE